MNKPTGKFERISDTAIVLCKSVFAMMTPEGHLSFHNKDAQASPVVAAALKELTEKQVITQRYNGIAEHYQPAAGVDFSQFRHIAFPQGDAGKVILTINVDPTKPLDLLPPSWAGSMIDNYRRQCDLPVEVTDGMIFARLQECSGMDPNDITEAVAELAEEVGM